MASSTDNALLVYHKTMPSGEDRSPQTLTPEGADVIVRQLWALTLSARYGVLTPPEEEEVIKLCHKLAHGIPGLDHFNRAAVRLCERLTSLRGAGAYDHLRVDGLLNEVDYL